VRPGRAADHSPPSSAAVLEGVELYLYPPSGPHPACNGITLPFKSGGELRNDDVPSSSDRNYCLVQSQCLLQCHPSVLKLI